MTDPQAGGEEQLSPRAMKIFGVLLVIVTGIQFALPRISFASLRLLDVDGYMRAQRVVDLLAGQNTWYDAFVYRANAPFGHALHWTRPVDFILIALSWPFTLFQNLKESVFSGSFVFGLVMVVSIFFAVAWAARAVMGRGASYLAGGATAFQLGLVAYNAPGHPDHHGLILLATALLMGHTLRLLQAPSKSMALRAGIVAGIGLWVATEFLFPLAVCLAGIVWRWVASGEGLEMLGKLTGALLVALTAAVALERAPSGWGTLEAERVSILHVLMAGLLALGAWVWTRVDTSTLKRRLVLVILSVAAVATILQVVFPGFFLGPVQAIRPSVDRFLDEYVTELAPTWRAVGEEWAGMGLLLGAPVLALIQGIWLARVTRGDSISAAWYLVVAWLALSLGLALVSIRYVPMAELLAGIPLAGGVEQWLHRRKSPNPLLRPFLIAWALVGYLVLVVAGSALGRENTPAATGNCAFETIERELSRELMGDEPIVLAGVPYGPELLWRLPVRVIGTPYLNPDGIAFTEGVFTNKNISSALADLDARGVAAIVVCRGEAGSQGYLDRDSFYSLLLAHGSVRGWSEVSLGTDSPFRIYFRR